MKGTEKQIKFARDILKAYIENAEKFIEFIEPILNEFKNNEDVDDDLVYEFNLKTAPILDKKGWDGEDEEEAIKILDEYIKNLKKYVEAMKEEKDEFDNASFVIKYGKDQFKYCKEDRLYLFPVLQIREKFSL